jgi:plastocyanin
VSTDDEQHDGPDDSPVSDAGEESGAVLVATPPQAPVPAEEVAAADTFRSRLLMPIVLPLASIFVAVLVALNISRLFLAGGEEQAPAVIVATVITVGILVGAGALSAARHVRTSSLVLGLSLVLVLVFSAGLITFGSGEEKDEGGGSAAPKGPAINTFQVDALPALKFQATEFTAPAGINEIEYVDKGGTHTLVFSDPSLSFFNLAVPQGPTKGKVDLEAGKDYTIYCTISGHRAAGMEAVVHVGAAPPPAAGPGDTTTTTNPAG